MEAVKTRKVENGWLYDTDKYGKVYFELCELGKYKGKTFMIPSKSDTFNSPSENILLVEVKKSHKQPRVLGGGYITIVEEVDIIKGETYNDVFFANVESGYFNIDGGEVYPGYTFHRTWNGWEMPLFDGENAIKILEVACQCDEWTYKYDPDKDMFVIIEDNGDGELETIEIEHTTVLDENGESHKVYDFGYLGWIWDEANPPKDEEDDEE